MTDRVSKVELALSHLLICDIINAKDMTVFLHKVRDNMIKIPKATYREKQMDDDSTGVCFLNKKALSRVWSYRAGGPP